MATLIWWIFKLASTLRLNCKSKSAALFSKVSFHPSWFRPSWPWNSSRDLSDKQWIVTRLCLFAYSVISRNWTSQSKKGHAISHRLKWSSAHKQVNIPNLHISRGKKHSSRIQYFPKPLGNQQFLFSKSWVQSFQRAVGGPNRSHSGGMFVSICRALSKQVWSNNIIPDENNPFEDPKRPKRYVFLNEFRTSKIFLANCIW